MKSRIEYIKKYCKNKTVLNLGCTSSNPLNEIKYDLWLQKYIDEYADEVIGIDIQKDLIKTCQKHTKNTLIHADVLSLNLNKKFDVVVAGEIIEHISNLDGFFKSIIKHLKKDGKLIITTPNVFKFYNLIYAIFGIEPKKHPGHILYFDIKTLEEILNRYGFKIKKYSYLTEKTIQNTIGNKMIIFLGKFFKIYNDSIVLVAKMRE
jgi:2-polyprenyl-3-methyl-5-hydroxy-6-metoxy-1,4-benzoquinol methylase